MKRTGKTLMILCMSLLLTLVSFHYNYEVTYANPVATKQPEQPSMWALEDVQMLSIYNIIDASMFQGYQSKVTKKDLYTVGVKLYEKLTNEVVVEGDINVDSIELQKAAYKLFNVFLLDTDFDTAVTRQNVVNVLYRIITLAEPTFNYSVDTSLVFEDASEVQENSLQAVKYTVSKKILNGTNANTLDLENTCTKEQLFALMQRTYYFVMQESERAAKGAFWKVSGGKSNVYLLGSVHLADSSVYPMNDDILNAFDASDALAVEVNLLDNAEGMAYMQEKMFFSDGTTIDQVLSEETYKAYSEKMESFGLLPKEQYDLLKPWSAAFTIQNLEAAKASYTAGLGIDVFFMAKAIYRKPIIEIEGFQFQTDLMDSFSPEIQEEFLKGMLIKPEESDDAAEAADTIEVLDKILESWKTGDVVALEDVVALDETATDEFTKKFWIDRNNHMYDSVLEYLDDESGKTYFVIVGAGHMISNTGIVKQLEDKGYTVEQIK